VKTNERAELVFHPFVIGLVPLALAPVEHVLGQPVALFLQVTHPFDVPPVRFGIHIGQNVQGLEDPAEMGQGDAELGGAAAVLQHAHHVGGRHRTVVRRADDAQDDRWRPTSCHFARRCCDLRLGHRE
jgi:hypothetical protein